MNVLDNIGKRLSEGTKFTAVAVGDSITQGNQHCTDEETHCARLAEFLAKRFPDAEVIRWDGIVTGELEPIKEYVPHTVQSGICGCISVVRSGVGGNTVRRALRRSADYTGILPNGESPDLYLLMFGINDALFEDKSKYVTPEVYLKDLKELDDLLISTNPEAQRVYLTPTYNDTGKSKTSGLDAYADNVRALAAERGYKLIDLHALWTEHLVVGGGNYGQRDWLSGVEGDGCHYSAAGAYETAKFIFDELSKE